MKFYSQKSLVITQAADFKDDLDLKKCWTINFIIIRYLLPIKATSLDIAVRLRW